MEGLRRLTLLAMAALAAIAAVGCSHEVTSEEIKIKDPYAAMSPQEKLDAIRRDPKINAMQKSIMISDAQKAAGQPVTGQ